MEKKIVSSQTRPSISKSIHKNATVGFNMESVAKEEWRYIIQWLLGGKPLLCYRGVKQADFIFDADKEC